MDSQLSIVLRPKTFSELVGNEPVVDVLQKQLDSGQIPRALMFVGPAGTGKTTLARIIARAAQGWEFPPDEEPDCTELNAAQFTGVDAMRELVDSQNCYPMRGKYRVIILDEAHMLSKPAQNLLLKPFEAGDSSTLWIICTTELGKLIKAIRTRCTVHELALMTKKDIHILTERAAKFISCEDYAPFEAEAIRRGLNSPRPLLNAFELFAKGMSAADAVNSQTQAYTPMHHAIAMAVVYGSWDKPVTLHWSKPVELKAVKTLLKELEDAFKKKKAADDAEAANDEVDITESPDADEEAMSRPDVASGLRAVTAAFLKNMVIKGNDRAADALKILGDACVPAADTALAYPVTIGTLFRVNRWMSTKTTGVPK